MEININLARKLIEEQFPEWSELPITAIASQGWDNRTFHLGKELLIRLPSEACYENQVIKEQMLLPILSPQLQPIHVPCPVAQGQASSTYPWMWSIYRWIPGSTIESSAIVQSQLAYDLANFLKQLQSLPTTNGPVPGKSNFFRGGDFSVYYDQAEQEILKLTNVLDSKKAIETIKRAASTTWTKAPVWVHGDISVGNLLCQNNRLYAVIDFGLLSVGDPACDYVMAWNYLDAKSRQSFREILAIDDDTWLRSASWELWKSAITLAGVGVHELSPDKKNKRIQCINDILYEL